jgi:hypothetical protein
MSNPFDINKFNSLIDFANNAISCDSECQKQKTANELKNKYDEAQRNLVLAEPQYNLAKKNYYTYVSGKGAYNEMIEDELNKKAGLLVDEFNGMINTEKNKIHNQIESYNGLFINYRNIIDLLRKYVKENIALHKMLKNNTNDALTNDRKTYYEDQQNDSLNSYFYVFFFIYVIVVICLIIFFIFYPSQTSIRYRFIVSLFFIILPFVSTWILGKIIAVIYWIYSLLPKNVYK